MNELASILKTHNLKVTPQRLAIYSILLNTKEHPSAEAIYQSLSHDHPNISLATVYKTLDTFKINNLVQELNVGEGNFRYDANILDHTHAFCNSCRKVIDIDESISPEITKQLCNDSGFKVTSSKVYLFGTCKDCQ
jgi:Fur family peroxide stress response transcriptional regulator